MVVARTPRRPVALFGLALLAIAATGACSSEDGASVDRPDVERAVRDAHGASAEQAGCVTDFVVEDYDDDEVATIVDDGITALPLGRWDAYFHSLVACFGDDGG